MSGKGIKKLPDAEFEIMRAIWRCEDAVTSPVLTEKLRVALPDKDWKQQTVMTMLVRLEKKGFLRSEKNGKERYYTPAVTEEEYMQVEANSLRQRFSGARVTGLVKSLCNGGDLSEEEISDLKKWLDAQ
ncbi:MAG: BlaI/MecI/CopY family transcriptional regulator [Clostridiales bacterium]|nr:BlaI/MecI/CopY family transcriptional regulator [Clostridiales bacterium]